MKLFTVKPTHLLVFNEPYNPLHGDDTIKIQPAEAAEYFRT